MLKAYEKRGAFTPGKPERTDTPDTCAHLAGAGTRCAPLLPSPGPVLRRVSVLFSLSEQSRRFRLYSYCGSVALPAALDDAGARRGRRVARAWMDRPYLCACQSPS